MCVVLNRKVEIGEYIASFGWVYRGENWLIAHDCCREWVASMMNLVRNKQSFYQRGPRVSAEVNMGVKTNNFDGVSFHYFQ
jgi:hypothetical protein